MKLLFKSAGEVIKAASAKGSFQGYASTFGNEDTDRDIMMPGAFSRSLADFKAKAAMPKMLYQHDRSKPIGDYLDLREDDRGLWAEGQLWVDGDHPVDDALRARRMMQSPGGSGLSIGFYVQNEEIDRERGVRKITDAKLVEISVVTFPANEMAMTTGIKAAGISTPREFEEFLRDAGFSREQAKAITATGFKTRGQPREAGPGGEDDPRDAAAKALLQQLREFRVA